MTGTPVEVSPRGWLNKLLASLYEFAHPLISSTLLWLAGAEMLGRCWLPIGGEARVGNAQHRLTAREQRGVTYEHLTVFFAFQF